MKPNRLSPLEQQLLESKCKEASDRRTDGVAFFIGQTADEKGQGHALIEVDKDGKMTRHWGTAEELLKKLA